MTNQYDIIILLMMSSINSELQSTLATMSKIQQEKESLSMRTQHLEANLQVRVGSGRIKGEGVGLIFHNIRN